MIAILQAAAKSKRIKSASHRGTEEEEKSRTGRRGDAARERVKNVKTQGGLFAASPHRPVAASPHLVPVSVFSVSLKLGG
jgi:hypothetical protein